MARFKTEADLAARVVTYLREWNWEVYQEVEPRRMGSTADIVAIQGRIVWVIECKLSFSLDLIGQARGWKGYAHRISVAVPMLKGGGSYTRNTVVKEIVDYFGLGQLIVTNRDPFVRETVRPRTQRRLIDDRIRESLTEHHKTYAKAGNSDGRRWTPFRHTCYQLERAVAEKPGMSLKELIESVDHHYSSDSSAKACISRLAQQGVIEGLVVKREGRKLAFYPPEREESGKKRK